MKLFIKTIIITTIILTTLVHSICGQETKGTYKKFIQDGVEYQTNGTDTVAVIDHLPEFPGGQSELVQFLVENINYPKKAKKEGIEGKVIVRFIIEKTGEVSNIKIVKSVSKEIDKEAVRVIGKMPKWKPAEQNGKPIRFYYNLPLKFSL